MSPQQRHLNLSSSSSSGASDDELQHAGRTDHTKNAPSSISSSGGNSRAGGAVGFSPQRNNFVTFQQQNQQQNKQHRFLSTGSYAVATNKMSRPTNTSGMSGINTSQDGDSVLTSGTFMVMTRPDGTRGCLKHQHLTLEGWTCPECEKEFTEGQKALASRKANLDNRLQELGQKQQQQQQQQQQQPQQPPPQQAIPSGTHSPMGPMSVQQQQQALYGAAPMGAAAGPPAMALGPYGTPAGLAASPFMGMPSTLAAMSLNGASPAGPPTASSSTSLETLALQINRMQQMQDWMLLQKEREVQMLRQELAEAQQKLHGTQLEHALLKEKMAQQKIQHEQELKYLQLTAAAAAQSNGFQLAAVATAPPGSNAGNESTADSLPAAMKDLKVVGNPNTTMTSMSTTAKQDVVGVNMSTVTKDVNMSRSTATGTATATTNTTAVAGTRKQAPKVNAPVNNVNVNPVVAPVKGVVVGSNNNNSSTKANGTANNAMNSPSNNNNKAPTPTAAAAAAPKNNAPKKTAPPKKNPPPAEAAKKATPAMKQPPPVTSAPNANGINTSAAAPSSNKTAPLERERVTHLGKQKNGMGDIPMDINVDDDAPPTVPLQEDITLGTLGKTQSWKTSVLERTSRNVSNRFEPRYIGTPSANANANNNNNQNNPADGKNTNGNNPGKDPTTNNNSNTPTNDHGLEAGAAFPPMLPSDQQSLTVASSTYGEDRQKVVNQSLLDPYGDKGIYTGLILKSTGMPHGSGRMIYEEDQRIYEGEWRHGRWHGFGRAKFANGDSYEGEYRFDQRHGQGKYSWADGRSYDGHFSEDRRHGKGLFVWPDGAIYEGEFANGQREGHGSYKFSDGGQYTGSWKDGRYNGYGTCSWEDGRCYQGEWRNGMAHGKGRETYADGTIRHDGQWIDDEPVR